MTGGIAAISAVWCLALTPVRIMNRLAAVPISTNAAVTRVLVMIMSASSPPAANVASTDRHRVVLPDDAAVGDLDDAIRIRDGALVVGHHDHRAATLVGQALEQVEYGAAGL